MARQSRHRRRIDLPGRDCVANRRRDPACPQVRILSPRRPHTVVLRGSLPATVLSPLPPMAAPQSVAFFVSQTTLVWQPSIPIALIVLAIAQMGVHLVFFLHITTGAESLNNVLALGS